MHTRQEPHSRLLEARVAAAKQEADRAIAIMSRLASVTKDSRLNDAPLLHVQEYMATYIANIPYHRGRSLHQQRVDHFMYLAGQFVPWMPMIPAAQVRILRAKLILEESLETVHALGVRVLVRDAPSRFVPIATVAEGDVNTGQVLNDDDFVYEDMGYEAFDLREVVDGCADIKVVTTGTLSAVGVDDEWSQFLIDMNNLAKFADPEGHKRADGKWVPSPNFKKADFYLPQAFSTYAHIVEIMADGQNRLLSLT